MPDKHKSILLLCCFLAALITEARADVSLPALISDGMVLQQGTKVNLWGEADPGEVVKVKLGGQEAEATAGHDRRWKVEIGPLSGGEPFTMSIVGKNIITLHDVLVGEVWICSGQSNMEMSVAPNQAFWPMPGVLNY